jgi:hypothetical protein
MHKDVKVSLTEEQKAKLKEHKPTPHNPESSQPGGLREQNLRADISEQGMRGDDISEQGMRGDDISEQGLRGDDVSEQGLRGDDVSEVGLRNDPASDAE